MMELDRTLPLNPDEEISALAEQAQSGDLCALEMLVLRLRASLFSVAYAELRNYDDAQDAVAAALLRICGSVQQMRQPERAKAWIDTIVRNEARRIGEEKGRRQSRETDLENRAIASVPIGDFTVTLRLDTERALRTLPYRMARAAALYYLEGNTVAQVAEKLECPAGTIKYWLHLGRIHLAHEMKEYDPAMETKTTISAVSAVALIASDENDETLRGWETALKAAGWDEVRIISDFAALVRTENSLLEGAQYLVLDHRVGGRSAFEAWPILKSRASAKTLISLLLLETKEDPVYEALVLSAYVSGFDFCLTKPLNLAELENFARQAKKAPPARWG